jgi:hypothetical protein
MIGRLRTVVIAAAALCFTGTTALAQIPGLTKDGFKCEFSTGKTLPKFVTSKTKCDQKCFATARKTSGPYSDCFAPFGGATLTCITDSTKGAEVKAASGIVKACSAKMDSCPKCFTPPSCTDPTGANPFVSLTENALDVVEPPLHCLESANITPDKNQAKCEDGLTKALVKFVGAKSKCYLTCGANAFKDKVTLAACTPPASDPETQTCITNAMSKTTAAINRVCYGPAPIETPPCYAGNGFPSAAEWVNLAEAAVDTVAPIIACGSPSGAFLQ